MWIRSQDKMKLYNISKIKIEQFIDKYGIVDPSVEDWILGEYESKERAIEVLDEIQTWIERYEAAKVSGSLFIAFITYEMPKE